MAVKVADRDVLVFWDWPCLYQKKDGSITPQQLDSFKRGLLSVNVLTATWVPCAFCAPRGTIRREVDPTTRGLVGRTSSPSFPPS